MYKRPRCREKLVPTLPEDGERPRQPRGLYDFGSGRQLFGGAILECPAFEALHVPVFRGRQRWPHVHYRPEGTVYRIEMLWEQSSM